MLEDDNIKRIGCSGNRIMLIITILIVAGFVLSLIPVLYISRYAHPLFDDYSYSAGVRNAVVEHGGISQLLHSTIDIVRSTYKNWQGTFSAVFLFSLQPAAFNPSLYFITSIVLLGSLVFSNILFWDVFTKRFLKVSSNYSVLIPLIILEMQIQFVPYIQESFYWYNGGIYYTFFYALEVVLISLLFIIWESDNKHIVPLTILSGFIGMIIGGGNYSNALTTVMFLVLAVILALLFKKRKAVDYGIILFFTLFAFIINVAAPGNSVRAANNISLPAWKAILASLKYAFECIIKWTHLPQIGMLLLLIPIFYIIIKRTDFNFHYPLVAIVLGFGFFAAQSTPPFFAMSSQGAQRQVNMYYYSYYMLMTLGVFYLEGWIIKRSGGRIALSDRVKKVLLYAFVGISLICIGVGTLRYGIKNTTFGITYLDLKSGRAQRYDEEYKRIEELILDSEGAVYTTDINEYPNSFYRLNLSKKGEIGYWINISMADYYGVEAIYLEE